MRLHPSFVLPVMPDETPVSYASRVAARLGRTLRGLLGQLGIPFQGLVDGNDDCVLALADAAGLDVSVFAGSTIKRIDATTYSVASERFRRDAVNRSAVMVCRECVAENLRGPLGAHGRYGRWFWQMASYRCCERHRSLLVSVGGNGGAQRLHDFAWHVDGSLAGLLASRSEMVEPEATALPAYIVQRVKGTAPDSWLSSVPLDAAVKTMEMVGITMRSGVQANWTEVEGVEWLRAGSEAYRRLAGGPAHLAAFLRDLRASASPAEFGLRKVYGSFYDYLDRHTGGGFEAILDIMREHIMATTAVGVGEVILGKPVVQRRLHSVRSASVEYELHPKTLRNNLTDLGIIEEIPATRLPHDRALFDAVAHAPLLQRLTEAMPRAEAQRYLGLSRSLAFLLDPPYVEPLDHGAFGRFDNLFTRTDLDRFGALVTAKATPSLPTDANLLPIGKLPAKVQKPLADIFALVLAGRLETIRWNGRMDGIGSLLVDPEEVRRLMVAKTDLMTVAEVKATLSCGLGTVCGLIASEELPSIVRTNSMNHRPSRLVPRDAVAKFGETYVSVHNLAREIGRHGKWLQYRLRKARVTPAILADKVGSDFYLRAKVPEILARI